MYMYMVICIPQLQPENLLLDSRGFVKLVSGILTVMHIHACVNCFQASFPHMRCCMEISLDDKAQQWSIFVVYFWLDLLLHILACVSLILSLNSPVYRLEMLCFALVWFVYVILNSAS